MKVLVLSSLAALAAATPLAGNNNLLVARDDCNHNNCLRAVIGSSFPTRSGAADCGAYLAVTVTPATSTVTQTVSLTFTSTTTKPVTFTTTGATQTITSVSTQTSTSKSYTATNTITTEPAVLQRRQASPTTKVPTTFPTYATACTDMVRYSSACSCVGVFPQTVTAPTPMYTTTVTASVTPSTSTVITTVKTDTATSSTTKFTTTTTTTTTTGIATTSVRPGCQQCKAPMENPSFTEGYKGWDVTWVGDASYIETPFPTGTDGSPGFGVVAGTNAGATIQQRLNTVPGVQYNMQVDYWFSDYRPDCYINAFVRNDWFWSFSPRFVSGSVGKWTLGTTSYTAVTCNDILVISLFCTAGENVGMRIDNMRLTPATPFNCGTQT